MCRETSAPQISCIETQDMTRLTLVELQQWKSRKSRNWSGKMKVRKVNVKLNFKMPFIWFHHFIISSLRPFFYTVLALPWHNDVASVRPKFVTSGVHAMNNAYHKWIYKSLMKNMKNDQTFQTCQRTFTRCKRHLSSPKPTTRSLWLVRIFDHIQVCNLCSTG